MRLFKDSQPTFYRVKAFLRRVLSIKRSLIDIGDVSGLDALAKTSVYTSPYFVGTGDPRYAVPSYSQEGEDMLLRRIYDGVSAGFYIDIGAHHPKRLSNTYFFYEIGWRGINIDAMPGIMELFNQERPRDINVEAAINSDRKELTFFIFNEPALNSFDEELARSRITEQQFIVDEKRIFTRTLKEVLSEHLPKDQKVNFLSVDIEGLDLEALKSNDWDLCRPEYILIECLGQTVEEIQSSKVYKYLDKYDYELFAKTVNTVLFRDKKSSSECIRNKQDNAE